MTQAEAIDLIQWGHDRALTWYATSQQKPIVSPTGSSVLGQLTGADLSSTGAFGGPIALGSGAVMVILLVLGLALIARSK